MTYYDYATAIAYKLPPWDDQHDIVAKRTALKNLPQRPGKLRTLIGQFLKRFALRQRASRVTAKSGPALSK